MSAPKKKEMENMYKSMIYPLDPKNTFIEKLKYLYKDPGRVIKSIIKRTKEAFYFISLPLMLHFFPSYIHLLVNLNERFMPKKNEKLFLEKNPENDFYYKKKQKKIYKEINIILRGDSIKKNVKKIDFSLPTFQVNFPKKLIKEYNPIHVTADSNVHNIFIKKTKGPAIFFRQGTILKKKINLEKENKIHLDKKKN